MAIKNIAASIVLGLLFASLVVIYLVTPQNSLVTFLSVVIMAVSLIIGLTGGWREVGVMAVFAALVSLIAARFVGQARWGTVGGVVIPILWLGILLLLFRWISRNRIIVHDDRATIIQNMYTGSLHIVPPPIAPPPMPQIQRIAAVIPKYDLSQDVTVKKIDTQAGQNIDAIEVHLHYRVDAPLKTMSVRAGSGIPNRAQVQAVIAKEMERELSKARTDVAFWEKLLQRQLELAVDDIVRAVVWSWDSEVVTQIAGAPQPPSLHNVADVVPAPPAANGDKKPSGAVDAYRQRLLLADEVRQRLNELVDRWGVKVLFLDLERFEVDPERFKAANMERIIERDTRMKKIEAEREAMRIELVRAAESAAEAKRVSDIVSTLRESGVELTEEKLREIVIDAILSAEEWERGERY